jgi:hypothetical protein
MGGFTQVSQNNQSTSDISNTSSQSNSLVKRACEAIADFAEFEAKYLDPNDSCFRIAVNKAYVQLLKDKQSEAPEDEVKILGITLPTLRKTRDDYDDKLSNFNVNGIHPIASITVHAQKLPTAQSSLEVCMGQAETLAKVAAAAQTNTTANITPDGQPNRGPFDKRLQRLMMNSTDDSQEIMPLHTKHWEAATVGYIISETALKESLAGDTEQQALLDKRKADVEKMRKDNYYIGVPALTNTYAITKLYGSEGGEYIVNQKGDRRWYEVDMGNQNSYNFASVPSTTSLINWGNGDPYGRTPYHFSDFVFCKYWNKIQNNRMITLRRYGAPILDNLKFPGMDGITKTGTSASNGGSTSESNSGTTDSGSSGRIMFPPMASAITYFGEETGNSINKFLSFSTGLKWDEAQANIWEVNTQSTPDINAGGGKLFGSLTKFAEMLNVAGGSFDPRAIQNQGNMPPDPYLNGPYENRIQGPINRIDKVKKRAPGLEFEMSGLTLQFEYVARPVGGINPKAALLDIMSNFFVIGSASAVFFGGQHRFMGNPATYPFIGGDQGIEQLYSGKSLDWAKSVVKDFSLKSQSAGAGIFESASQFFNTLLSGGGMEGIFGAVEGLFTGGGAASNLIENALAKKTAGEVPYLTGLKALLTGEPVGEWHLTIGNPLNPIAMIGNLICTGIEVEFGEELGPDDFPTEIKFTVKLDHGMARDRDAIQSIFNRGMGRIYDLPDNFLGSADYQTAVDNYTQTRTQTGTMPDGRYGVLATSGTMGRKLDEPIINENKMHSDISVWRGIDSNFLSISPNASTEQQADNVFRSQYRAIDWVAQKSLR